MGLTGRFFNGLAWKPIELPEMYTFLGIVLQISLFDIDGGYEAFFATTSKTIHTSTNMYSESKTLHNRYCFAQHYMDIRRFKQIRASIRPESIKAKDGTDKVYHLRYMLNVVNDRSKVVFLPSATLVFDEGVIGCRSRYCPVLLYNKSKPDRYRIEFFILEDSNNYAILHIDIYQGMCSSFNV